MTKSRPLPPLEELQAAFEYDPASGLFFHKDCYHPSSNGSKAGSFNAAGYVQLHLKGKRLKAHRVAWYLHTKSDPQSFEIDHIDHNRSNNRISNLRLATSSQNSINRKAKGWSLTRFGKYKAQVRFNGEYIHLGVFKTQKEAEAAYQAKAIELWGEWCYCS